MKNFMIINQKTSVITLGEYVSQTSPGFYVSEVQVF